MSHCFKNNKNLIDLIYLLFDVLVYYFSENLINLNDKCSE